MSSSKTEIDLITLARRLSSGGYSQMSLTKLECLAEFLLLDAPRLNEIPGDCVECGVWRGASAALIGCALDKPIHLYDSFAGMPPPTNQDFRNGDDSVPGRVAGDGGNFGAGSLADTSIELVHQILVVSGLKNFFIHPGFITETSDSFRTAPDKIALLHIDLDFYEPYCIALKALYPRMSPGGLIIFDDYGHFIGAKRAVDEFIASTGEKLKSIDHTSRRVVIVGAR